MIRIEQLSHAYPDNKPTLNNLTFAIQPGEKVVLLGTNGSGKTSLLKILNGLIFPSAGRYYFNDQQITKSVLKQKTFNYNFRKDVMLLFQNPEAMIFNPTVFDEIAFGLRQLGADHIDDKVRHWAGVLGIAKYLDRPPFHLSSGEKQKVCLASLLAMDPKLLLLDEPTAKLDPRSTGWLVDFLMDVEKTTLVTTHNLTLAGELGERTLVLSERHELTYDGDLDRLLDNKDLLQEANLLHIHRHKHNKLEHGHYHTHDWE
jgi:cobalt/nickel transport system ATP-binding protein